MRFNVVWILMILSMFLCSGTRKLAAEDLQILNGSNDEPQFNEWQEFNDLSFWRFEDETSFLFRGRMTIDADGASNAYHPDSLYGLDFLANAGSDGNWWGIAKDENGELCVQGEDDPCPGYYVSTTSMFDSNLLLSWCSPEKYVNAAEIPYFVLPTDNLVDLDAEIGCLSIVYNTKNGMITPAIFADRGGSKWTGEGSIKLVQKLGLDITYSSDPKYKDKRIIGGGADSEKKEIVYLIFPHSVLEMPLSVEEIDNEAYRLFNEWGGLERLKVYVDKMSE
jgi:hypothetical protein